MKKKIVHHPVKKAAAARPKRSVSPADRAAVTVAFETPEFAHHPKNELWYLGIGLLVIVGVVAALGVANYLLAIVAIAAGLAIIRVARERPEPHQVVIDPTGVQWGERHFGFHQFKAFWAAETDGQLSVYLERPNFQSVVHFTVPDEAAEKVLTFLSLELPFHWHREEPLSDRLSRLLRI